LHQLRTPKTKLEDMCFGISDRGNGLPQPNRLRYQKPKDFKASILESRAPNDQAARLTRKEEESNTKPDTGFSEKQGQAYRPRNFSFVCQAGEETLCKQNTTFEALAKRGVIPKSALEPLTKAEKGWLGAVSHFAGH